MVLMNDFAAEPREIRDAMLSAASRVFHSGWYVLGPEVRAFEAQWARVCGTEHCIGVANGMDAIELVLRALEIGAGDEVITTPMTAFATVLAVLRAGAQPVLADIDSATGLLSVDSVRRCLTARTRALLPVHLYGQLRDPESWVNLCREAGIQLIEDCAQSHLARWNGRTAGSFGVAGAYSFYPTKNLGAIGDGGAVVTDSPHIAERIRQLRNYGQRERYVHALSGMNSRLDELQAALLQERLKWLPGFTRRRREIAAAYAARLHHPSVALLAEPLQPEAHVHHLFVVRCEARQALQAHLEGHGIQSLIHYPVPAHLQKPGMSLARDPLGLSAAEAYAGSCLSIPCQPQMSDADVDHVVETINRFEPGA